MESPKYIKFKGATYKRVTSGFSVRDIIQRARFAAEDKMKELAATTRQHFEKDGVDAYIGTVLDVLVKEALRELSVLTDGDASPNAVYGLLGEMSEWGSARSAQNFIYSEMATAILAALPEFSKEIKEWWYKHRDSL